MTDGIIQEVFKRNKNLNISLRYRTHLERIEQELIEEIRLTAIAYTIDKPPDAYNDGYNLGIDTIRELLIGDNQ